MPGLSVRDDCPESHGNVRAPPHVRFDSSSLMGAGGG
jgi:hypothetical protein